MDDVYSFEAKFTDIIPIGQVSEGLRLDVHFVGTIVNGPFTGGTVRGIDYLLFRPDGIGIIDVREMISTPKGETLSVRAYGYVVPPEGVRLPPAEVMLRPDFEWPDVTFPFHGFALAQTGATELSWMNHTALAF
jgi:hypothetical protein